MFGLPFESKGEFILKNLLESKKNIFALITLPLLLFTTFVIYPLIRVFIMAFQNFDGFSTTTFIGLDNFRKILSDQSFMKANISSIFLMVLAIIFNVLLAVVFALIISGLSSGVQKFVRMALLIPMILSITVISQLWLTIYNNDWGLLNTLLDVLGLSSWQHQWLSDPKTAMVCIGVVGMWWTFGNGVLMISSGIKSISPSLFEAAAIDGASNLKIIRYITLPLLKGIIKTVLIMTSIGGLFTFPQVYIMTGGGPGDLTQTLMMYMYRQAFSNQRYGVAGAVAIIAIIESCIVIFVISKLLSNRKEEKA